MPLIKLPWATKRTPIKLKAVYIPLEIKRREVRERCDAWDKKGLGGDMGTDGTRAQENTNQPLHAHTALGFCICR